MDNAIEEYLKFQVQREITGMYKSFLEILEDLKDSNYNVNQELYQKLRKKVLDRGNNAERSLFEHLDKVNITLK